MDADDPQTEDSQGKPVQSAWFPRRKRIVAHEVQRQHTAEVEQEMLIAGQGLVSPGELIDPPPIAPQTVEPLVDLTVFTGRHRKAGANRVYRLTQFAITVGTLAAAIGIFCALQEDAMSARILSGSACVLGFMSITLVRRSRLAHRLRGYAGAMCVLAVLSAGVSWIPIHLDNSKSAGDSHSDSARP
jgi:hypothetical protein